LHQTLRNLRIDAFRFVALRATSACAKPPCPDGRLAWASAQLLMSTLQIGDGVGEVKRVQPPLYSGASPQRMERNDARLPAERDIH
jgi:hypothetical protein